MYFIFVNFISGNCTLIHTLNAINIALKSVGCISWNCSYAPLWVSGVEYRRKRCFLSNFCTFPFLQTAQTHWAWTTGLHLKCTSALQTEKLMSSYSITILDVMNISKCSRIVLQQDTNNCFLGVSAPTVIIFLHIEDAFFIPTCNRKFVFIFLTQILAGVWNKGHMSGMKGASNQTHYRESGVNLCIPLIFLMNFFWINLLFCNVMAEIFWKAHLSSLGSVPLAGLFLLGVLRECGPVCLQLRFLIFLFFSCFPLFSLSLSLGLSDPALLSRSHSDSDSDSEVMSMTDLLSMSCVFLTINININYTFYNHFTINYTIYNQCCFCTF